MSRMFSISSLASSDTYEDDFEDESDDCLPDVTEQTADFARVLDNYQSQLTRHAGGDAQQPIELPASGVDLGVPNMASRTSKLREECICALESRFETVYTFLFQSRNDGTSEDRIRQGLIKLMGFALYQRCGLSLDQLVWQDMQAC